MKDNPATRLKKIVRDTQHLNGSYRQAWASYFGIQATDTVEIARHLLMVIDVFKEVREVVSRHRSEAEVGIIFAPIANFEGIIFPPNLDTAFQSMNRTQIFQPLNLCENIIAEHEALADTLGKSERDDLNLEVEELMRKVGNSDLPDDVKKKVVEKLEEVRSALFEYELTGTGRLRRTCQDLVSTITMFSYGLGDAVIVPVWSGLWDMATRLATVVTLTKDGPTALTEMVSKIRGLIE